ncbi:hypothetical protein R3P38DRAFT_3208958 [Favolaschia claudopus]|uniref:Uncharacterized protein n=1 Tax=Favolaschia claudopus TaxID=2862362 RepID=A0AAW0AKF7_9AGAR
MKASLAPLFLTIGVAVYLVSADLVGDEEIQPCTVQAWVRAEDLSPNHVSRGELRIKVSKEECADLIASVALRLQFDEFGQVKHLKNGAVLPEVRPSYESASTEFTGGTGDEVVYDYQAYDDSLIDSELWTIEAEERSSWMTEAILLQNPDVSKTILTPFTVAVPAVNYPAVVSKYRNLYNYGPVAQHAFSDLGYRYTTIVTFVDGRIKEIPSGHTAFIPSSERHVQSPLTWNLTFEESKCRRCEAPSNLYHKYEELLEKCLPKDQRSAFTAEITIDSGKVAAAGQTLKGLITVHTTKHGTTIPSDIFVYVQPVSRDHWAHGRAAAAGDSACPSAWSGLCNQQFVEGQIYSQSERHSHYVFEEKDDKKVVCYPSLSHGYEEAITSSNSRITFEFSLPADAPVDTVSYYSGIENFLNVELTVLHSLDVARCLNPGRDFLDNEDDPAAIEEGLWDTWTRLGSPAGSESDSIFYRQMTLHAMVPITVVGPDASDQSFAHYLEPNGAVAPLLRSGFQMDMPASFAAAKPLITAEAIAETSARLLQPAQNRYSLEYRGPDPTYRYQGGDYVGLLWRKKVVAEAKGIWPLRNKELFEESEHQQPLKVAP